MKGMGRKRKGSDGLPKYVYLKRGWYVWRRDMLGLGSPIRLVRSNAPLSSVWAAWESVQRDDHGTLSGLLAEYIIAANVTDRTRKDYQTMARRVGEQKLADGRSLSEVSPDEPDTQFWRHYLDSLSATPVAANRRMQLIKAAYAWGYQRGKVCENTSRSKATGSAGPGQRAASRRSPSSRRDSRPRSMPAKPWSPTSSARTSSTAGASRSKRTLLTQPGAGYSMPRLSLA